MSVARWLATGIGLLLLGSVAAWAAQQASPITISADSLELNRKAHVAVYRGNVAANDQARGMSILADQIEFFFDEKMEDVERAAATGNVRISYGERRGSAERAEYFPHESRAVLLGSPKIWQDNDSVTGCKITLFLREDKSRVDGCGETERVNAVITPKRTEGAQPGTSRR
jgi:lipopolysaccharide export system protein LptA